MSLQQLIDRFAGFRPVRTRRGLLTLALALGGFGAVAFAVAPLSAGIGLPAEALVTEAVPTDAAAAEVQDWRQNLLQLHHAGVTQAGDTLATALRRLGVNDAAAAAALAGHEAVRQALGGDRRLLHARTDGDGDLLELTVRYPAADDAKASTHYRQLSAQKKQQRWAVRVDTRVLSTETRMGNGTVQTQLRAAATEAGLPAAVATQLVSLCTEHTEGGCDLAKGDRFAVLYETLLAEGEPVPWNEGVSRVLAARFVAQGAARQLTWFVGPDGKGGYFDSQGRGREGGFRASPVEYTKITSGFATRIDPFLRRPTEHRGVDFSAPMGTPVNSVAPGVVEFAGRQTGYGNVVEVRHGNDRTTLYAHLSRIDVAVGDRVGTGHLLGAVGATGWATGPHLHFEYRVAGVHQDPQLAASAAEAQLVSGAAKARFERQARAARAELDRAMTLAVARNTFE